MNEENLTIIGDDIAVEEQMNPSAVTETPVLATHDGWPASRKNALAETFLRTHKAEFENFERLEIEKQARAEQFRALETELARRRQWLETLREDIATYEEVDIAADIYANMGRTGQSLLDIARNPLFSAAAIIREHGGKIISLAEADLAGLQKNFDAFKGEKNGLLENLPSEAGLK